MNDRDLVRLHWPAELRPAFDALFGIDDAMADVVGRASQPGLAAIKLAWWREALERLDTSPPPAEPRLQAIAKHLLPRGISGSDVSKIEEGWAVLLNESPDFGLAEARGAELFGLGGRLLGQDHHLLRPAGRLFAGMDLARRGYRMFEPSAIAMGGVRFPKRLRPMTALTALAVRDLKHGPPFGTEASPGRAFALLRHRLTGTIA